MSLSSGNFPLPACPRCRMVPVQNENTCRQCGYQISLMQQGRQMSSTQAPSSSNHTALASQFVRLPSKPGPGSRLSSYVQSSNTPSQNHALPSHQPVRQQQPPTQTGWSSSRMQPSAVQVNHMGWMPQPVQTPSLTIAQMSQPVPSSSQPGQLHRKTQTATAPNDNKEQPPSHSRRALVYFTTVSLAIMLLVFAVFHATGVSLSMLTTRGPAPTPTAYPVPKATPLFADAFQDDSTGWNLQSVAGSYAVAVGNGKLTLENDKNSLLWELLPGMRTYSNFELRVNAILSKGEQNNGYGIYIRGASNAQSDLASYYRFELYGDASYAIFKGVAGAGGAATETQLTKYVVNSAIQKQGKINSIIIIAKGSSLSFIVNNQLLATIKDSSYTSGSVAFFVSNLPKAKPGAQAQFSQFVIYPV